MRRPPRSTLTDPLFPYTPLCLSASAVPDGALPVGPRRPAYAVAPRHRRAAPRAGAADHLDERVRARRRHLPLPPGRRGGERHLGLRRRRPPAVGLRAAGALQPDQRVLPEGEIGRAHVCTPVTNAHLVCSLLLEKKT